MQRKQRGKWQGSKTRLGVAHLVTGNRGFSRGSLAPAWLHELSAHACLYNLFKFRNIDSTFSGKERDRHMEEWIPFAVYIKTCTHKY